MCIWAWYLLRNWRNSTPHKKDTEIRGVCTTNILIDPILQLDILMFSAWCVSLWSWSLYNVRSWTVNNKTVQCSTHRSFQLCYPESRTAPQPPSQPRRRPSQTPPCFPWRRHRRSPVWSSASPSPPVKGPRMWQAGCQRRWGRWFCLLCATLAGNSWWIDSDWLVEFAKSPSNKAVGIVAFFLTWWKYPCK